MHYSSLKCLQINILVTNTKRKERRSIRTKIAILKTCCVSQMYRNTKTAAQANEVRKQGLTIPHYYYHI